ncbi:MAG: purine-nucleoside phosphorylase [Planctomycetes bacterium]|nr:purine-nucleoside phosphorylase [Planctomycetota bacterium]
MIDTPFERAAAAAAFLTDRSPLRPTVAIVLGSGMGAIADHVADREEVPFDDLPGFPAPSVPGHAGKFVIGRLVGHPVVIQCGRVHYYEGHDAQTVMLPPRTLAAYGAKIIIFTNAAGGLDPAMRPGEVMMVEDHINFIGANPMRGEFDARFGERFIDMSAAYDRGILRIIEEAGSRVGLNLLRGVYAAVSGPSYETPAEVRMLRLFGADAVGMSTVPEVLAARQRGVRVGCLSLITNRAAGLAGEPLSHAEVEREAKHATVAMGNLVAAALPQLIELAGR